MSFVICEPGSGILCGMAFGLWCCWGGSPDSGLDESEIQYFSSHQDALATVDDAIVAAKRSGELTSTIERWEVVEILPTTNITQLAQEWAARN